MDVRERVDVDKTLTAVYLAMRAKDGKAVAGGWMVVAPDPVAEVEAAVCDFECNFETQQFVPYDLALRLAGELKEARMFIAETGDRLTDKMYDDPTNRLGLSIDCKAVAGNESNLRYLDVKWQTGRAIAAERDGYKEKLEQQAWCDHEFEYFANTAASGPLYRCRCGLVREKDELP